MKNNNDDEPAKQESDPIKFTVPDLSKFNQEDGDEYDLELPKDVADEVEAICRETGQTFDDFMAEAIKSKLSRDLGKNEVPTRKPRRRKFQAEGRARKLKSGQMEVWLLLVPEEVKALRWFIANHQVANRERDLSIALRCVLRIALSNRKNLAECVSALCRYCRAEGFENQNDVLLPRLGA
jgi:hypothetical protein